jgi:hypothetical protein
MPTFLRARLAFLVSVLSVVNLAAATDDKAKAVSTTPPVALPALVDAVTFQVHIDGENHKLVAILSPNLLRVDEPDDRLSIIYDARTDHYTGLEHGNYTYWQFAWADVRDAIETSKRYENRLHELNSENAASYQNPTNTNAVTSTPPSAGGDSSGYVWNQTTDKKRISNIDCVHWTGKTTSGETVDAWCSTSPLTTVQDAMERLRTINEPVALVPVRILVPPFVFTVYDALVKGGVTPVSITWGVDEEKNQFTFVEAKKREGKPSLFAVPSTYNKTTLVTMDGMIDQKK